MNISQPTPGELDSAVSKLKAALLTGSFVDTVRAHKALHGYGDQAAEPILRELRQIDLAKVDYPEIISLVTGLATSLHDLSEAASVSFAEDTLKQKCHPAIAASLRNTIRFRRSDYRESQVLGMTILEEKTIDERYRATAHVSRWLHNIPAGDLADISRLYLISEQSHHDFRGNYQPYLAVITLAWSTLFHPSNPFQWFRRARHEFTLYHEVGHHREGHTEYGQDPEQEKQADAYARRLFRQAHPGGAMIGRALPFLRRKPRKQDGDK